MIRSHFDKTIFSNIKYIEENLDAYKIKWSKGLSLDTGNKMFFFFLIYFLVFQP